MKTCSNIHCEHYDEIAKYPCEDCRRAVVNHQADNLADPARIERLKQWEKHKHNEQHPKKDE